MDEVLSPFGILTDRHSANYFRRYEKMPAIEDYKTAFAKVTELVLDAVCLPWAVVRSSG
jgi:hypothetical protein